MQIWFLSNGSYSLKKCHNPFGKAIQPPPPYGKIPVEHVKSLRGASLTSLFAISFLAVLSLFRNWLEAVLRIKQNRLDLGGQAVLKWCVECCWKENNSSGNHKIE